MSSVFFQPRASHPKLTADLGCLCDFTRSASASLTAGVAALFLQMNPGASPGMVQSGVLAMCKQGGVNGLDETRDNNFLLNMNPNPPSISPLAPYAWPSTPKAPPGVPLSGDAFPAYSSYLPSGVGGGKGWDSSSGDVAVPADSAHPPVEGVSEDIQSNKTQQGMVRNRFVAISHDAGISSGMVLGGIAVLLLVMGIGPPLRCLLPGEKEKLAGYELVPIREAHQMITEDPDLQEDETSSSPDEHSYTLHTGEDIP